MATIYSAPPNQQQMPQQAQSVQVQSYQQPDPLFEALAKYITSGPGSSAISASTIQEIIDGHDREYLNAVVGAGPMPGPTVYKNHLPATGFLSTNLDGLTLVFDARQSGMGVPYNISYRGFTKGFFPPQVVLIENATFFFNDVPNGNYDFAIINHRWVNGVSIEFYGNPRTQEYPPKPICELQIVANAMLPDRVDGGNGEFKGAQ